MSFSYYIIPVFILIVFMYSAYKHCDTYQAFVEGSKEGMKTSISILPYLFTMYVGVKIFNASGFLNDIIRLKNIPSELILQGIFRPFSSNASMSFMLEMYDIYGVDSKEGITSSVLYGGSDTTIYVMTLYFGSIGITNSRYGVYVGLLTDVFCFSLCLIIYFLIL